MVIDWADEACSSSTPDSRARDDLGIGPVSVGMWQNFGTEGNTADQLAVLGHALDRGVTHFDLANNYGPPPGSAEDLMGVFLAGLPHAERDRLVLATKAGHRMWPGPYGDGGSRKYLLASLDASLRRLGVDHVELFYSHRPDPETPLEETVGALHTAVRSGRALGVGLSKYPPSQTLVAAGELTRMGTPVVIHQDRYSMINRGPERGVLQATEVIRAGFVAFAPLAQGLLTGRYLTDVPSGSRAYRNGTLGRERLTDSYRTMIQGLRSLALARGQSIAQMAISWVLRDRRVTSAIVGASSIRQLDENLDAAKNLNWDAAEVVAVDALTAALES